VYVLRSAPIITAIGRGVFWGSTPTIIIPQDAQSLNLYTHADNWSELRHLFGSVDFVPTEGLAFTRIVGTTDNYEVSIGTANRTGDIFIPAWTPGGGIVTAVANSGFRNTNITGVVFQAGLNINRIGTFAFAGTPNLTGFALPEGVTTVGNSAFEGSGITNVIFSNGLTRIENRVFYNSALASVTIPNSVNHIGDRAFANTSIANLTIPSSVSHIGAWAFSNMAITSITIPAGVVIGQRAFANNLALTSVIIQNGVTRIGDGMFSGSSALTSVAIPNTVTGIGDSAFSSTASLRNIVIPRSVTSIETFAFSTSGLLSITLHNTIATMGRDVFSNNSNLTIFAEATSRPSGWRTDWIVSNRPIIWGVELDGSGAVRRFWRTALNNNTATVNPPYNPHPNMIFNYWWVEFGRESYGVYQFNHIGMNVWVQPRWIWV